jgi:hypothetical protein
MVKIGKTLRTIALITALAHGASGCDLVKNGCRLILKSESLTDKELTDCVALFGISAILAFILFQSLKHDSSSNGSVSPPPGGGTGI